ncbi:MAG: alanine racemase [Flavobacteriaceae bacterium]|nr:alanine racemase [Flavobacteriaceae bacterium]
MGQTVLSIHLDALAHNYHYLRSKIEPKTNFMGVVKAFAYGSDAEAVALKLQELGIDYLAVAYVSEGICLRKAGVEKPILVLHPQLENLTDLVAYQLEPSIYSFRVLKAWLAVIKPTKETAYPVHIKINTGLNRLGFSANEIASLSAFLEQQPVLKVASVFSHLAATEDPQENSFTLQQIQSFKQQYQVLCEKLPNKPWQHILNTSGILNYAAEAQFDMVRSGIGLYGFGNDAQYDSMLKPIAQLHTIISQIHELQAGDTIGYNRAHLAQNNMRIGVIPLGHADGIGRQYGNQKGQVWAQDQLVPIVGNVCMDMMMIDLSNVPHAQEGDTVCIFGKQPTAVDLAATANTISYELITGISQRVKRQILP